MRIEDQIACFSYSGGAVSGKVAAGSHHGHTNGGKDDHEEETLSSAPDVEDLGQGNVDSSSHDVGDSADDGHDGVRLPLARGVGGQGVENLGLETVDEVDEPHATRGVSISNPPNKQESDSLDEDGNQRPLGPGECDGLGGPHTMLGILSGSIAEVDILGRDAVVGLFVGGRTGDCDGVLSGLVVGLAPYDGVELVQDCHCRSFV